MPRRVPVSRRSLYARTNADAGFKLNQPDGWVSEGPVWWWGSDSVPMAPQKAGHSAVTKATNIVVGTLTSGEWTTKPGDQDPRWLTDPMLVRRDDRYGTPIRPAALRLPAPYFWGQWIRSALLWGMGWLLYAPDEQGFPWPGSMWILNPWLVKVDPDGTRWILGQDQAVPVGPEGQVDGTSFRLLELRNPLTPVDTSTGVTPGVLAYHEPEMKLLADMVTYAGGTFRGAGVPSGYLKVTNPQISKPQADALRDQWLKAHGSGSRSVAVLSATTDYTPIAVSPVDAGLADMTKLSLVSVANAFSIPYSLLGAPTGDSMTYSNLTMDLQALEFALLPWVRGVEGTLSPLLPAGRSVQIKITTQLPQGGGGSNGSPGLPSGPPEPEPDVPPR